MLRRAVQAPVGEAAELVVDADRLLRSPGGVRALVHRHELTASIGTVLDDLEARIVTREAEIERIPEADEVRSEEHTSELQSH